MLGVLFVSPVYAQKFRSTASLLRAIERSKMDLAIRRRTVQVRNVNVARLRHHEQFRTLSFPTVAEVETKWGAVDRGIAPLYERSVKSFMEIKHELNIFFEYQRLEPEFVSPIVKREKEDMLNEAHMHLHDIAVVLSPQNPSVQLARTFLKEAFEALHPTYALIKDSSVQTHLSRQLVDREFLLWKPDAARSELMQTIRAGTSIKAEALQKASELPTRVVAFINDDPEMLEWARQWAAQGYFGPGSRVAVFDSLSSFTQVVDGGALYDLVLIDWVLDDGFALPAVQKIRANSRHTVVLLNSALQENEVQIEEMFNYGFDGFVSSIGFRADTGGARIALSLWNYEYYKTLYNWER